MISLIQHFEADFLRKVSLKILNSGINLKTFTHGDITSAVFLFVSFNSLHPSQQFFTVMSGPFLLG